MNDQLKTILKTIARQPQRQDSTTDQLSDLRDFANRLGMYDAADIINTLVRNGSKLGQ